MRLADVAPMPFSPPYGLVNDVAASAATLLECPNCPASQLARQAVFGDQFWPNLALLSLPFVVLGLVTSALYRIGLAEKSGAEGKA